MAKTQHSIGQPAEGKVLATPTKDFFVTMLTRDIELLDAIMDLVDNCIDGVHREQKNKSKNENGGSLYEGYFAEITLNKDGFSIKDNCGGIPLEVARLYAFKMGRSSSYHADDNLETVGMYGIGMKRAIFKMGLEASVTSWNSDDIFKVTIPKNWAKDSEDWNFDLAILKKSDIKNELPSHGTHLSVGSLHENIGVQFQDKSPFIRKLEIELSNHYGYIVQQGFTIKVNTKSVKPIELNILTTEGSGKKTIKPYAYADKIDNVEIEVIIGFYRPPATEEEKDRELDGAYPSSTSENAGITVLCNDRVVLYADKTHFTGWGENPVPLYHTQFIAIAGVVHFRSTTPLKLPVTTTKRGLDTSSQLYSIVKNRIKEGLKIFTSFTNFWKTPGEARDRLFANPQKLNALVPGQIRVSPLVNLAKTKRGDTGTYQIPDLPKPDDERRGMVSIIRFTRDKTKVESIARYYLSNPKKPASEVGAWCFDQMLHKIEMEDK